MIVEVQPGSRVRHGKREAIRAYSLRITHHPVMVRPKRGRVLAALRSLAEGGTIVHASTRAIGDAAGCSHPTVRAAVADLAARGIIDVLSAGEPLPDRPGRYRINEVAR